MRRQREEKSFSSEKSIDIVTNYEARAHAPYESFSLRKFPSKAVPAIAFEVWGEEKRFMLHALLSQFIEKASNRLEFMTMTLHVALFIFR